MPELFSELENGKKFNVCSPNEESWNRKGPFLKLKEEVTRVSSTARKFNSVFVGAAGSGVLYFFSPNTQVIQIQRKKV